MWQSNDGLGNLCLNPRVCDFVSKKWLLLMTTIARGGSVPEPGPASFLSLGLSDGQRENWHPALQCTPGRDRAVLTGIGFYVLKHVCIALILIMYDHKRLMHILSMGNWKERCLYREGSLIWSHWKKASVYLIILSQCAILNRRPHKHLSVKKNY